MIERARLLECWCKWRLDSLDSQDTHFSDVSLLCVETQVCTQLPGPQYNQTYFLISTSAYDATGAERDVNVKRDWIQL